MPQSRLNYDPTRQTPSVLASSALDPTLTSNVPVEFGVGSSTCSMSMPDAPALDLDSTLPGSASLPDIGPPCTCHLRRIRPPPQDFVSPHHSLPTQFMQPSMSAGTTQAPGEISMTLPASNEYTQTLGLDEAYAPMPAISGLHSSVSEPQSINHQWALHAPAPSNSIPTPSPADQLRSCMCMSSAGATSLRPADDATFLTQQAVDHGHFPPHTTSFPSIARSVSSCTKDSPCLQNLPPSPQDQEFLCLNAVHEHRQVVPAHSNNAQKRLRGALSDEDLTDHLAGVKRVRGPDGIAKEVCAISRVPYVRHQQPKKLCPYCKDHPGGFRGEHELRRHVDRAHARQGKRKMWVCVDASPDGRLLSDCKKCRSNKKYGAYYNAAAHLRRTHFNPRPRGSRAQHGDEDFRGGRTGGDDPPMDELKRKWIKEVEVEVADVEEDREESSPEAGSSPHDEPKTPNSAAPAATFLAGRMDGYGLSLEPSSPLGIYDNKDSDNSCASVSSSDDSHFDALLFGCPLDLNDLPLDTNMTPITFSFQ